MKRRGASKKTPAAVLFEALQNENLDAAINDGNSGLPPVKKMKSEGTQTDCCYVGTQEIEQVLAQINKCLLLLSHVNTKVDALAAVQKKHDCQEVKLRSISLEPVKDRSELDALEDACQQKDFVKQVAASIGQIHGRQRYTGRGATVCLQIVDFFFNRQFLLECSWTGTSRKSSQEQSVHKVPFSKYKNVIELFYQTVLYSDPHYTLDECQDFLHRCLRNAKQRVDDYSGTRKSAARKRTKLHGPDERNQVEESDVVHDLPNNIHPEEQNQDEQREQDWQTDYLEEEV